MEFLGGRKNMIVWAAFLAATVGMFLKFGSFSEWTIFTLADIGLYVSANVVQRKIEAGGVVK